MDNPYDSETGCCPRFEPSGWDGVEHEWSEKLFVKDRVRSVFHIPINFGKVMVRTMEKVAAAEAFTEEPLMLSDENSLWGSDLYVHVSKDVAGAEMARISGSFLTKVFEGPYKNVRVWCGEMEEYVKGKGKELEKLYFYYTTCPKCAKVYGKNYVVLVAQV